MQVRRLASMLSVGLLLSLAEPALAQSTKERLAALERAVAELQAAAPTSTDASLRVARLEEEIQRLTGRIEELTYQLDQANARLAAVTSALSGGAASADGAPAPLGASGDPIADTIARSDGAAPSSGVELPIDPAAAFEYASSFLKRGDYARAKEAFELYVKAFPNHPQTADAQFRLGEIYLAQGANADAAQAFIDHIRKFPNNPRAAEAYLKLGTAFSRMQKTAEACTVFKTMKSKFPSAATDVQSRAEVEMARISCK